MLLKKQVERVFATGITTKHPELAALGDADNALCIVEFVGGKLATFHLSRTGEFFFFVQIRNFSSSHQVDVGLV